MLDGAEISGYSIVTALLPVEWGTVKSRLEALIDEVQPVVILSLGLAAGRSEVSVEKVAINYTSESKDNAGVIPVERMIIPGAPDGYFTTLPAEEIVEGESGRHTCRVDLSAGAYLCNYVFTARLIWPSRVETGAGRLHPYQLRRDGGQRKEQLTFYGP